MARPDSPLLPRHPLDVRYDDQVVTMQRRGGISRYFVELIREFSDPTLGVIPHRGWRWTSNQHALEAGLGAPLPIPWASRGRVLRAVNRMAGTGGRIDIHHPTYYRGEYLARASTKPMVVSVYDMTPELYPDLFRQGNPHLAKREFVQRASLVLCISESTRRDLLRVYGNVAAPTVVTHLGASQRFTPGITPPPWCPKRYVLFVGNRGGYKDFAVALDAFADLAPRQRELTLLVVGGGAFSSDEHAAISRRQLGSRVIQGVASDDELPGVYNGACAFVFPSRSEGFGLPTLEAMACGTPVVLADASSHPEIGGSAALYFPPGDSEALARQLEQLVEDDAARQLASESVLAQASRFTWRRTAIATATAYREAAILG